MIRGEELLFYPQMTLMTQIFFGGGGDTIFVFLKRISPSRLCRLGLIR
ncbi:MAG: hypothetical protein BWX73_02344 [Lentisphaerae bacterium ADurb.Bin082]|nr:MAG: hypothetical protein BWX73_02344 [Lentisphaerae bacterium ADurb.Bin082]